MRQKSVHSESASEGIVKNICGATRKRHSSEEKIRIILDGMRDASGRTACGECATLAAAATHARLQLLERCGRLPHFEAPAAFPRLVLDFWRESQTGQ
jgi:hypothetical protein